MGGGTGADSHTVEIKPGTDNKRPILWVVIDPPLKHEFNDILVRFWRGRTWISHVSVRYIADETQIGVHLRDPDDGDFAAQAEMLSPASADVILASDAQRMIATAEAWTPQ